MAGEDFEHPEASSPAIIGLRELAKSLAKEIDDVDKSVQQQESLEDLASFEERMRDVQSMMLDPSQHLPALVKGHTDGLALLVGLQSPSPHTEDVIKRREMGFYRALVDVQQDLLTTMKKYGDMSTNMFLLAAKQIRAKSIEAARSTPGVSSSPASLLASSPEPMDGGHGRRTPSDVASSASDWHGSRPRDGSTHRRLHHRRSTTPERRRHSERRRQRIEALQMDQQQFDAVNVALTSQVAHARAEAARSRDELKRVEAELKEARADVASLTEKVCAVVAAAEEDKHAAADLVAETERYWQRQLNNERCAWQESAARHHTEVAHKEETLLHELDALREACEGMNVTQLEEEVQRLREEAVRMHEHAARENRELRDAMAQLCRRLEGTGDGATSSAGKGGQEDVRRLEAERDAAVEGRRKSLQDATTARRVLREARARHREEAAAAEARVAALQAVVDGIADELNDCGVEGNDDVRERVRTLTRTRAVDQATLTRYRRLSGSHTPPVFDRRRASVPPEDTDRQGEDENADEERHEEETAPHRRRARRASMPAQGDPSGGGGRRYSLSNDDARMSTLEKEKAWLEAELEVASERRTLEAEASAAAAKEAVAAEIQALKEKNFRLRTALERAIKALNKAKQERDHARAALAALKSQGRVGPAKGNEHTAGSGGTDGAQPG